MNRDIVKSDCKIKWKNVQGNDHVKLILKESVILPLTYPHLFTELTKPWKGVLLHGVSGVGKTLMAKALNSETFDKVTFFNMSASTLISKWRGESEKFLKVNQSSFDFWNNFLKELNRCCSRWPNVVRHQSFSSMNSNHWHLDEILRKIMRPRCVSKTNF